MRLKGKVTVELTDIKTGEKKKYEQNNLVTNAIRDILTPALLEYTYTRNSEDDSRNYTGDGGFSMAETYLCPLGQKGYGGIILWDNAVEENADNYAYPPKDAHIVGYADQDSTTDAGMRGSMNKGETHWNDDGGITTVWDWGTSQGNGKIQAISLVNYRLGGQPNDPDITSSYYYLAKSDRTLLYYDEATGYGYSYQRQTIDNVENFVFYREKYMIGQLNLKNKTYRPKYYSSEQYAAYPWPKSVHSSRRYSVSYDEGYFYFCMTTADSRDPYKYVFLSRCKLEKLNDANGWEVLMNEVDLSGSLISGERSFDGEYAKVMHGYLYLPSNTGTSWSLSTYKSLYKVNVNNAADVTRFEMEDGYSRYLGNNANGSVSAGKTIIYADNKSAAIENTIDSFVTCGHYLVSGSKIRVNGAYLGTIFNLSEVNKTATQTMKVTYTLSPAEENTV